MPAPGDAEDWRRDTDTKGSRADPSTIASIEAMQSTDIPEPGTTQFDEDAGIGDVLRWLVAETEAESAAYILLTPSGNERLLIEPRGLSSTDVGELVEQARHAMIEGRVEAEVNVPMAHARWLGKNGSKIVILRGVTASQAAEALRFARFVIEWLGAPGEDLPPSLGRRGGGGGARARGGGVAGGARPPPRPPRP